MSDLLAFNFSFPPKCGLFNHPLCFAAHCGPLLLIQAPLTVPPHPATGFYLPGRGHWTVSTNTQFPVLRPLGILAGPQTVSAVSHLCPSHKLFPLPGIHPSFSHLLPMPHYPTYADTSSLSTQASAWKFNTWKPLVIPTLVLIKNLSSVL